MKRAERAAVEKQKAIREGRVLDSTEAIYTNSQ
jgi:hypothetical protein